MLINVEIYKYLELLSKVLLPCIQTYILSEFLRFFVDKMCRVCTMRVYYSSAQISSEFSLTISKLDLVFCR